MKGTIISDLDFEQMLAKYNTDFREAKVFNTIMPDDGNYVSSAGVFDEGNKDSVPWWKLTGRIEVAENPLETKWAGAEYQMGFFGPKTFGFMKEMAAALAQRPVADLRDAIEVMRAAAGTVSNVKIVTTKGKNGKDYTNCYVLDVINEVQPEAEAVEGVPDAPEPEAPVAEES